jgi:hypothetical protein
MATNEFPIEAYLNAVQQKRQAESQQGTWASALGGGIGSGIMDVAKGNEQMRRDMPAQRAAMFKQFISENILADESGNQLDVKGVGDIYNEYIKRGEIPPGITSYNIRALKDQGMNGQPTTSIPKPSVGESTLQRERAKNLAKSETGQAELEADFTSTTNTLNKVKEANKNAYAGIMGNLSYEAQVKSGAIQDEQKVKDTAFVRNELMAITAKMLKATFGGQLSDSERKYLNDVNGAAGTLSTIQRDTAIDRIRNIYKTSLERARSKTKSLGGLMKGESIPETYIPQEDNIKGTNGNNDPMNLGF